jgi:hypothetical protein
MMLRSGKIIPEDNCTLPEDDEQKRYFLRTILVQKVE